MKKFVFLFIFIAGMGVFLLPGVSLASSCGGNYAFGSNGCGGGVSYRGNSYSGYDYGFSSYRNNNNYRTRYDYGFSGGGYRGNGYAFGGSYGYYNYGGDYAFY